MAPILSVNHSSRVAATLATAFIASAVAGCGIEPREEPACDPAAPPSCVDATTRVTCGADGTPSTETCAAACLEMADAAGHQTAACVASGTVACQTATFAAGCVGDDAFVTCAVLPPLEGAGHTTLTACSDQTTCRESTLAVACVDPLAEPCDPATYGETCAGSAVTTCDERGFTAPLTTCAAPKLCKVSAGDARCVRPDQDPCDATFVETCADAATVSHCSAGFTDVYGCSGVCRQSATSAACFSADLPTCVASRFQERCEGSARITCNSYGVEAAVTCEDTMRCEVVAESSHCIDLDAVACDAATHLAVCDGNARVYCNATTGFTRRVDCGERLCHAAEATAHAYCVDPAGSACEAATFEARCENGTAINCDATSGWTSQWACPEGDACYVGGSVPTTFAFCDKPGAVPCDFATYPARCEGAVASFCSLFTNYTMTTTCKDTETCHADRFCLGPTCGQAALCLPPDGAPCDGTKELWCDGATIMNCFDGIALSGGTCEEGKACTVEGDTATCR